MAVALLLLLQVLPQQLAPVPHQQQTHLLLLLPLLRPLLLPQVHLQPQLLLLLLTALHCCHHQQQH